MFLRCGSPLFFSTIFVTALSLSSCQNIMESEQDTSAVRTTKVDLPAKAKVEALSYAAPDEQEVVRLQQEPVATRAFLGSAPHICTPSGFGQRSRCFTRN